MIPNITRGGNVRGVLSYLLGPGRREEHTSPHLVAGSAEALLRRFCLTCGWGEGLVAG